MQYPPDMPSQYPSFQPSPTPPYTTNNGPAEVTPPKATIMTIAQPSSPVRIDADADDLIHEYIDWHIGRQLKRAAIFRTAEIALFDANLDLEAVQTMTEETAMKLGISIGLRIILQRDLKVWRGIREERGVTAFTAQALQAISEIADGV